MGAGTPLDGLRRALSRLGAQVRTRPLDAPFAVSTGAPEPPAVLTRTVVPLTAGSVPVGAVPRPAVVARAAGIGAADIGVRGHAATVRARARGGAVGPLSGVPARPAPALPRAARTRAGEVLGERVGVSAIAALAPPAARRGSAHRVGVMRRVPLAWSTLERERLRAAWDAVRDAHADAADLELVGIYGPVPVSALAGAAVGDDRVAHLALGSHRGAPVVGDLALARHREAGGLVSAVVTRART